MNLGKRIESRLLEMGEERSFLFDLIPELTPARLSALITRDSKRCELDVQIAKALKVRLEWLNSGELPQLIEDEPVRVSVVTKQSSIFVKTPPPETDLPVEFQTLLNTITDAARTGGMTPEQAAAFDNLIKTSTGTK